MPVVVARKPLVGTLARNVLEHGTGGINVDGCRVGTTGGTESVGEPNHLNQVYGEGMGGLGIVDGNKGRWPTNVLLSHAPECHESVVVARKPLDEKTVAKNVLEHGTGGINIDACRVSTNGEVVHVPQSDPRKREGVVGTDLGITHSSVDDFQTAQRESIERTNTLGRWPANVLLSHASECELVGEREVVSTYHQPARRGPGGLGTSGHVGQDRLEERRPHVETVTSYECVQGCPVAELDRQSGFSKSPKTTGRGAGGQHGRFSPLPAQGIVAAPGDQGGASRFFKTFGPEDDKESGSSVAEVIEIIQGDCVEVMREMVKEGFEVDAIVCDPPYSLSFMGREWDSHGSSAWFQSWCEVWATEALRLLKPGGHLLAFGGTRTYHRLACAIEDAGFEIRDSINWLYGCLSDDTEILTETGWKLGVNVTEGEQVAQWDPATGQISLAAVEQVHRYRHTGPMRKLKHSDTDQLLTLNHRVWRESKDGWRVTEAGSLSTWSPVRLPIGGLHDGPGIGGADYAALLGWVWTEGGFDKGGSRTGVRVFQSSVNRDNVDEIAALLDRVGPHKRYDYPRTYTRRNGELHNYTATTWYFSGEFAEQVRRDLPGKHPTYELLWRMTQREKQAFLEAAVKGDGHTGKNSVQFFQKDHDDLLWFQTLLAVVGKAGKVGMRGNREGGAVYLRNTDTTQLQARHLKDSFEFYEGTVWCVTVPTGAFVARRNGLIFITGNSGFPKSMDVSKAIDKAAGATRTKRTGTKPGHEGFEGRDHLQSIRETGVLAQEGGFARPWMSDPEKVEASHYVMAPATDDAAKWQGWGSALKPAHEPIVMARKPLSENTVVKNVLEHGTGAINIDGTRVGTEVRVNPPASNHPDTDSAPYGSRFDSGAEPTVAVGRWPANVVFSHSPGCVEVGTPVISNTTPTNSEVGEVVLPFEIEEQPRFMYCAKASRSERNRGMPEGITNGHPTVKPLALMRYLVRLVTPPGGLVVDPFAGSGTTVLACKEEGFNCIGIERDADYVEIAKSRISIKVAA
jgi:DNA methylase